MGADNPFQQPARLTFQAIRTHLNQERVQLEHLLRSAFKCLRFGGRLVVVCFKRDEVTTVRHFLREYEEPSQMLADALPHEDLQHLYPLLAHQPALEWCVREACSPLLPTAEELRVNTRSRSAQAIVLEKLRRRHLSEH